MPFDNVMIFVGVVVALNRGHVYHETRFGLLRSYGMAAGVRPGLPRRTLAVPVGVPLCVAKRERGFNGDIRGRVFNQFSPHDKRELQHLTRLGKRGRRRLPEHVKDAPMPAGCQLVNRSPYGLRHAINVCACNHGIGDISLGLFLPSTIAFNRFYGGASGEHHAAQHPAPVL